MAKRDSLALASKQATLDHATHPNRGVSAVGDSLDHPH